MSETSFENEFKVRLVSAVDATERVAFNVSPILAVSAPVEYSTIQPIHMPGAMMVYKNTGPRVFNLNITLISRTPQEATISQNQFHLLHAWRYPYFGRGSAGSGLSSSTVKAPTPAQPDVGDLDPGEISTNESAEKFKFNNVSEAWTSITGKISLNPLTNFSNATTSIKGALDKIKTSAGSMTKLSTIDDVGSFMNEGGSTMLGAPPPILLLSAYSSDNTNGRFPTKNYHNIPAVITNFDFAWPNNVDYIPTVNNEPFPVKMELTITLTETHSPREFENFSLSQYKSGTLPSF